MCLEEWQKPHPRVLGEYVAAGDQSATTVCGRSLSEGCRLAIASGQAGWFVQRTTEENDGIGCTVRYAAKPKPNPRAAAIAAGLPSAERTLRRYLKEVAAQHAGKEQLAPAVHQRRAGLLQTRPEALLGDGLATRLSADPLHVLTCSASSHACRE
mmetsp:Transcript_18859/g.47142  ORF Transcript_18859/g.47142 Transcript_18859/m.47142 type:complete len:155 (+) Transcript_18859:549-1013(+)